MDEAGKRISEGMSHLWRVEQKRQRRSRLIRWGLGISLILTFPWFGAPSVFSMALGFFLIGPDIASYPASLLMHMLYPMREGERRPVYGIPQSLMARGRYVEAEEEYEKIIQEFPNEVTPHIDMLNIAVMRLNNAELAEQIFQRGMTLLKQPAARETLSREYDRIRGRLKASDRGTNSEVSAKKLDAIRDRIAKRSWR